MSQLTEQELILDKESILLCGVIPTCPDLDALPEAAKLFADGVEHFRHERYFDAHAAWTNSLALQPTWETHTNIGVAHSYTAKLDEAFDAYDLAAEILAKQGKPVHPGITKLKGIVFLMQNSLDDARNYFSNSAVLREKQGYGMDPSLFMNLGIVLSCQGQPMQAIGAFDESARLREELGLPEDWMLVGNRANLFVALKRFEDALAEYERAYEVRTAQGLPEQWMLQANIGLAYINLNKLAEAFAAFAEADRIRISQNMPADPTVCYFRAMAHNRNGEPELAGKFIREAQELYVGRDEEVPAHITDYLAREAKAD